MLVRYVAWDSILFNQDANVTHDYCLLVLVDYDRLILDIVNDNIGVLFVTMYVK